MMNILDAFILGIVQGFTEFLPVSSSGHLLFLELIGVGNPSLLFNVLLHLGSLLAVIIVFRSSLRDLICHPLQKKTLLLVIATIPTCAIALVFKYAFPSLLEGSLLAFGFLLTSCFLFATKFLENNRIRTLSNKTALLTGICQGIAVLPGVSRSGATISTLMLLGVPKEEAFEFSFLLSIPIIIASAVLESNEFFAASATFTFYPIPIVIGFLSAFVTGFISLKIFASLIKKQSLVPFAIYTAVLAVLALVFSLL
ncbi:MAG: undecaprenyl-diphosphate phosphatase [Clostridia bacterium]|nr:undecaprenyl-diphosphate phosphatase [Clostridia bacterium]